jgi:hypothetical protein
MKKVINFADPDSNVYIPVELKQKLSKSGKWEKVTNSDLVLERADSVAYLGKNLYHGELLAVQDNGMVNIYKGELNSGLY